MGANRALVRGGLTLCAYAGYVFVSSLLGLMMPAADNLGFELGEYLMDAWTTSLASSLFFGAGSSATGFVAYELAKARPARWAVLVGMVGSWIVYVGSGALLLDAGFYPLAEGASPGEIIGVVSAAGAPGLAFAATAPAAMASFMRRRTPGSA